MKVGLLLLVLAAAQGCGAHVVSSKPRSVIVDSWWNDDVKAKELADAECAKYSRLALAVKGEGDPYEDYVFKCVDR